MDHEGPSMIFKDLVGGLFMEAFLIQTLSERSMERPLEEKLQMFSCVSYQSPHSKWPPSYSLRFCGKQFNWVLLTQCLSEGFSVDVGWASSHLKVWLSLKGLPLRYCISMPGKFMQEFAPCHMDIPMELRDALLGSCWKLQCSLWPNRVVLSFHNGSCDPHC